MSEQKVNCVISVSKEKAMRQIEELTQRLEELSRLVKLVNETEIVINISVTHDKKKWYQFWK